MLSPSLISLGRLLQLHPCGLHIAPYQRHYLWGEACAAEPVDPDRGNSKPGACGESCAREAAAYLTQCLIDAYHNGKSEYFLQGISVSGDALVDGQQRLTFLCLLLRYLGYDGDFTLKYTQRDAAQHFLLSLECDDTDVPQDVYLMRRTLDIFSEMLSEVDRCDFMQYILCKITFIYMPMASDEHSMEMYRMINGSKSPMLAADLIKADIMRMASDSTQPSVSLWGLYALRSRYALEWETWVRWWRTPGVSAYFREVNSQPLDLLLKLCLRDTAALELDAPLSYEEFRRSVSLNSEHKYHAAKHIFHLLRYTQRRFEEAYSDTTSYNRIKAVMLLQRPAQSLRFLQMYFVDGSVDADELDRYYRLSFLGMSVDEIARHESSAERFDDLVASLSMADVYHTEAKRDAFNLLLRLNIDEDIKLQRRFDFDVWSNRSLEHIFSKSKVWHIGADGRVLDGNDNVIRTPLKTLRRDPSYLSRDVIVNTDGTHLSEHCIGNLVLLYGQNNAEFGNAGFNEKKMMFLAPGDRTVFRSRNLLHSVCVFAGNEWTARKIVENYNLTLKNLKLYYGYK